MTDMNPELRLAPEGTVFDEYVAYVRERHRIWELRSLGLPAPWTRSPILGTKKFTNDFRVLDTGSQYVLRMVQDAEDPIDVVLRAFLYRFTNLPEPWEAYREEFGRWPEIRDVGNRLDDFLRRYAEGASILNSAYVIAPPSSAPDDVPVAERLADVRPGVGIAAFGVDRGVQIGPPGGVPVIVRLLPRHTHRAEEGVVVVVPHGRQAARRIDQGTHMAGHARVDPGVTGADVPRMRGEALAQVPPAGGEVGGELVEVRPGALGVDVVGGQGRDPAQVVDAGADQGEHVLAVHEVGRRLDGHARAQDQARHGDGGEDH